MSKIELTLPNKITTFLAKDHLSISIVFIKQDHENYTSSYMTIDKKSIENIRQISSTFIHKKTKWDVVKYGEDLDNERKTGVYRTIDINQVPKRKSILKKPTSIEQKLTQPLIDSTVLIGFRFELSDQKPVMFLKKINSNYFVLEQGFYARVISGVVQLTKNELFKLPDTFDLVTYGDELLIFNPKMFEKFFGFYDIYNNSKNIIFEHLTNHINYEVDGLDSILDEVDSTPRFLRKFRAIEEKEIYNQRFEDLKKVLKIRSITTVEIIDNKFKFKGTQAFIDFYNDNYLNSYFTNRQYTALSKTRE